MIKTKIEVAKTLLDLADKEFTRLYGTRMSDLRARTVFYQTFAVAMLVAHFAVWQAVGIENISQAIASALSAGIFAATLFLSVLSMSGAAYRETLAKYKEWSESSAGTEEDTLQLYRDALAEYDKAIACISTVINIRAKTLRRLNVMTLIGLVLSAISVSILAL